MVDKLKILLAAFSIAISMGAWPSSGRYGQYLGPCDLVTCAEAYSVARAMKNSYAGPLFQLNNGSSTLDIGQHSHRADMTTWSAFCSGVASNCTISKVYAQIHTTANDLTPFNTGTAHQSVFTIETATGLPIWVTNNSTNPVANGQQYTIGGPGADNPATGINALGAAESVLTNILPTTLPNGSCCGQFGTAHVYNICCTGGTDFMVALLQGTVGPAGCDNALTYCLGVDNEETLPGPVLDSTLSNPVDYTLVPFAGVVGVLTFDPTPNKVRSYVNGVLLQDRVPGFTMNPGQRVHYGGGGDLTGPNLMEAREMLITNSSLTQSQISTIQTNTTAFYPGVSFPSGPNNPATYASGPGDVVPGAKYYNAFRAYTAAIAAAGTQQMFSLTNIHSVISCGVLTAANGGPGLTTACNDGGASNGQTLTQFCTSTVSGILTAPQADCFVAAVQDQANNVANYVTLGTPRAAWLPNCINFTPCSLFTGGTGLGASITLTTTAQPYTMVAIAGEIGGTTEGFIMAHETGAGAPGEVVGVSNNVAFMQTNTSSTFPQIVATTTNGVFHILNAIFNAASSSIIVDGVTTNGTVGADAAGVNPTIRWGNSVNMGSFPLKGGITETGLYPFALTPTQQANLRANQRAYWGF